jgi:HD-GYP domain-containing protein (c-di-GMP phosphodiesterase class II)
MSAVGESLAFRHAIDRRRDQIARRVLDRLAQNHRTIAAKVLVIRFLDQCTTLAGSDAWHRLPTWIDDVCTRYNDVLPAPRILGIAVDEAVALMSATAPLLFAAFAPTRSAVDDALTRPRTTRLSLGREAIDEIDVVVDGLLTRLDQTDVLTAEHSRAVASWCSRLGAKLGASKTEIAHLSRAGLVHDIGKVTTPAAILSAPRRLDDEEMVIMREHAAAGGTIIAGIPLLANLLPAVRNHHERIDGTGYPDALRNQHIPQIARIVAVADAFNAMIGRRPYRPAVAPSIALERLVEGRGTQFDPDVVDAMIDVVAPRTL